MRKVRSAGVNVGLFTNIPWIGVTRSRVLSCSWTWDSRSLLRSRLFRSTLRYGACRTSRLNCLRKLLCWLILNGQLPHRRKCRPSRFFSQDLNEDLHFMRMWTTPPNFSGVIESRCRGVLARIGGRGVEARYIHRLVGKAGGDRFRLSGIFRESLSNEY